MSRSKLSRTAEGKRRAALASKVYADEQLREIYRELMVEHRAVLRELKLINEYAARLAQRLVDSRRVLA